MGVMPKVPVKLAKKVLDQSRQVRLSPEQAAQFELAKEPMKKAAAGVVLKQPDLSEEEVDQAGVVEALAEAGELGESGASTLAMGAGLASLLKVKGAAGLAGKAGRAAGVATVALNAVDLARTLVDDDYREEVKASLEGMDGWDGFQQGLTRAPSLVTALQSVNEETADQFEGIEEQDARTDRQLYEMRLRKKARQQETERVNEEQRRALEAPSAEEKIRMAKLEDEMEKQNARNMVRSYLEEQGLV
jgi:hypothetical protein